MHAANSSLSAEPWIAHGLGAHEDDRQEDPGPPLALMASTLLAHAASHAAAPLARELARELAPYAQHIGTQVLYGASLAVQMIQRPFNALCSLMPELGADAAELRLPIIRPYFPASNAIVINDLLEPDGKPASREAIGEGLEMLIDELRGQGHRLVFLLEQHGNPSAELASGTLESTVRNRADLLLLLDGLSANESKGSFFGLEDPDFAPVGQAIQSIREGHSFDRRVAYAVGFLMDPSSELASAAVAIWHRHPEVAAFARGPLQKAAGSHDIARKIFGRKLRKGERFSDQWAAFVEDLIRTTIKAARTKADWHDPVTQLLDHPEAEDASALDDRIFLDIRETMWEERIRKIAADFPNHTLVLSMGLHHLRLCERLSDLHAPGRRTEEL